MVCSSNRTSRRSSAWTRGAPPARISTRPSTRKEDDAQVRGRLRLHAFKAERRVALRCHGGLARGPLHGPRRRASARRRRLRGLFRVPRRNQRARAERNRMPDGPGFATAFKATFASIYADDAKKNRRRASSLRLCARYLKTRRRSRARARARSHDAGAVRRSLLPARLARRGRAGFAKTGPRGPARGGPRGNGRPSRGSGNPRSRSTSARESRRRP